MKVVILLAVLISVTLALDCCVYEPAAPEAVCSNYCVWWSSECPSIEDCTLVQRYPAPNCEDTCAFNPLMPSGASTLTTSSRGMVLIAARPPKKVVKKV